jgi:uncharacterized protein
MGIFKRMWTNLHVGTFIDSCKYGNEVQVETMLSDEPELAYSKDKRGISALFHAVANGHNKIVAALLDITKQPDDVEPEKGFTPVMMAATSGHIAVVRLLLEHGANPDLRNFDGITALHNAVFEEQCDIVALLIQAGANPEIHDRLGNTALELAERSGHDRLVQIMRQKPTNQCT